MPILLTELAAKKAKELIEEFCFDGLRFAIHGGGCAGYSYILEGASTPTPEDIVTEQHGVKVFCDKKSYLFLNGTTIDYEITLMNKGFKFINPNATGKCGCGTSFSA